MMLIFRSVRMSECSFSDVTAYSFSVVSRKCDNWGDNFGFFFIVLYLRALAMGIL